MRISRNEFIVSLALGGGLARLVAGKPETGGMEAGTRMGSLTLTHGRLAVNGRESEGDFSVHVSEFRFVYFAVPATGLFIISASEFADSLQAGAFEGKELRADIAGITLTLSSKTAMLQGDSIPAWIRFDSAFQTNLDGVMFGYGDSERIPYQWPTRVVSDK